MCATLLWQVGFQMGLLLESVSHCVCWGAQHSIIIPECYQTCLSVYEGFHVKKYVCVRLEVKYHLSYLLLQPVFHNFTSTSFFKQTSNLRFLQTKQTEETTPEGQTFMCVSQWLTLFHKLNHLEASGCNLEHKLLHIWHSKVTLAA